MEGGLEEKLRLIEEAREKYDDKFEQRGRCPHMTRRQLLYKMAGWRAHEEK